MKFILITLLFIGIVRLSSELAFVGKNNIILFEVKEDFHHGIIIVFEENCIVENLIVAVITFETIDGRHVDSWFLLIEVNVMCKDLIVLRVHQNSFVSQHELAFLFLAFWRYDWNIVPNNVLVEVFFNQDDLLVQGHQENVFVQFIKFALVKNPHFKHMVNLVNLRLYWQNLWLHQLGLTHVPCLFHSCIQTVLAWFIRFPGLSVMFNLELYDMQNLWHFGWWLSISINIKLSLHGVIDFLLIFGPKVVKAKCTFYNQVDWFELIEEFLFTFGFEFNGLFC